MQAIRLCLKRFKEVHRLKHAFVWTQPKEVKYVRYSAPGGTLRSCMGSICGSKKGVSVMSIGLSKSPKQNSAGPILSDPEFVLQVRGVATVNGNTAIFQVCQECKVGLL